MPLLIILLAPFLAAPVPVVVGSHMLLGAAAYGVGCVEYESDAAICSITDIDPENGGSTTATNTP